MRMPRLHADVRRYLIQLRRLKGEQVWQVVVSLLTKRDSTTSQAQHEHETAGDGGGVARVRDFDEAAGREGEGGIYGSEDGDGEKVAACC